jgi:hypothetical protein
VVAGYGVAGAVCTEQVKLLCQVPLQAKSLRCRARIASVRILERQRLRCMLL